MLTTHGEPLADLDDWSRRAGPKHPSQWKCGRSAMEVARAWLDAAPNGLPPEIVAALSSNSSFGPVLGWEAEPEVRLPIDGRRGEPRNTDLLVHARDADGPFLIAVEAKADEPFDRPFSKVLDEAFEAKLRNVASGAFDRAVDLARSLLPPRRAGLPHVGGLRYQLFTAAAGVLREAERRGLQRAVLLVHEFVTQETTDANHDINASDLDAWVLRISGGKIHKCVAVRCSAQSPCLVGRFSLAMPCCSSVRPCGACASSILTFRSLLEAPQEDLIAPSVVREVRGTTPYSYACLRCPHLYTSRLLANARLQQRQRVCLAAPVGVAWFEPPSLTTQFMAPP